MLVGFKHPSIEELASLWNSCFPDEYKITPKQLRTNTVDCPLFDWGASVVDVDDDAKPRGFVVVKHSGARLYAGPDPDQAHVSAIVAPTPRAGLEMMAFVKQILRNRGLYKIAFGQDSGHFFPGCPAELAKLKDFLVVEGFAEGGPCFDLCRDLGDYEPPAKVKAVLATASVVPLKPDDLSGLEAFLTREFPGRWTFDTLRHAMAHPELVYVLKVGGKIEGFALTQDKTVDAPIGGAVFSEALGKNWGALGPIGISKQIRGRGYGDAILAGALLDMKRRGIRSCVIDWTVLTDWYGRHGFEKRRTYLPFTLRLDETV